MPAEELIERIRYHLRNTPLDDSAVVAAEVSTVLDNDGNQTVQINTVQGTLYLDEKMADLIASAVGNAVYQFLVDEGLL